MTLGRKDGEQIDEWDCDREDEDEEGELGEEEDCDEVGYDTVARHGAAQRYWLCLRWQGRMF